MALMWLLDDITALQQIHSFKQVAAQQEHGRLTDHVCVDDGEFELERSKKKMEKSLSSTDSRTPKSVQVGKKDPLRIVCL